MTGVERRAPPRASCLRHEREGQRQRRAPRGGDRRGLRRHRHRGAAAGARVPRHAGRPPRRAGRARLHLARRGLHLGRRPHGDHRAVADRGAVRAGGAARRRARAVPPGRPLLSHPVPRRRALRLQRRSRAHGGRDRQVQPRRRRRLPALRHRERAHLPPRLRAARRCPLLQPRRHGARGAVAHPAGLVAHRVRHGLEVHPGRPAAAGDVVPPAAGGRQPVRHHVDLRAHPLPRAQVGRLVCEGRHRRGGSRAGRPVRVAGRRDRLVHRRRRDPGRRVRGAWWPARARGAAARRGRDRGRHRGLQRRRRGHLPPAAAGTPAAALDRRAHRSRALLDGPVRRLLRHPPSLGRGAAPHHPARPALPGPARRHLQQEGAAGRPLALPAPPDLLRPAAGAARLRRVLRAGAGAQPGRPHRHRLGEGGRAAARPHLPLAGGDGAAGG